MNSVIIILLIVILVLQILNKKNAVADKNSKTQGLLPSDSLKQLEKNIAQLQNDFQELSIKIAQRPTTGATQSVDKIEILLQNELLKFEKNNNAVLSEIKNFQNSNKRILDAFEKLNNDQQKSKPAVTDISGIEAKLNQILTNVKSLIDQAESKSNSSDLIKISNSLNSLDKRLSNLPASLKDILSAYSTTSPIAMPPKAAIAVPEPERKIEPSKSPSFPVKTEVKPVTQATPQSFSKSLINSFQIERTETILFSNNLDAIQSGFLKIENVNRLKSILENNASDDARILLKNLDQFVKDIARMKSKLNPEKLDRNEISDAASRALANVLENSVINKFVNGIYRGFNYKPELKAFYSDLLSELNSYLKSLTVYTKDITLFEKQKISDDMFEFMQLTPKKTDRKEQHEVIAEIERLPYILNFINEDGEPEILIIKGMLSVFRYENKTSEVNNG